MALKFQPPQGVDTTSPNEAFNKGLGNTLSNLPLLYQQMKQAHMENQIKERTLAAQLDQNQFTRGIEEKKLGIQQQEADTNKYKAEHQPGYVVPIYDETGNVTGYSPVPQGMKPFGGRQPQQNTAENKKSQKDADKQAALNLYETARDGLLSGLGGSKTGPFMGRLPAVTEDQQVAEGAVAAMAPVLKQLFRVSGEGVFTDRDQALLLDMIPTRKTKPEARAAQIENIDKIVRAKLGVSGDDSSLPQVGGTFQGGKVLSIKKVK